MSDENLAKRRCCGAAVSRIPVSWRYEIGDVSLFTRHFQNNRVATRRPSPAMRRDVNSEEHGEMLVLGSFLRTLRTKTLSLSLRVTACHCVSLRVTVPSWSSCLRGSIFHPCRCHVCRFPSGRPLGRTAAAVVWFRRSSGRRSRGLTEKHCWTKQTKQMLMQLSPISSRQLEGMMQTSRTLETLETFWHTSKPCLSPPQLRCRKAISQHSLCQRNVWVMFQSHRRWSWTSRMESPNGWFLVT